MAHLWVTFTFSFQGLDNFEHLRETTTVYCLLDFPFVYRIGTSLLFVPISCAHPRQPSSSCAAARRKCGVVQWGVGGAATMRNHLALRIRGGAGVIPSGMPYSSAHVCCDTRVRRNAHVRLRDRFDVTHDKDKVVVVAIALLFLHRSAESRPCMLLHSCGCVGGFEAADNVRVTR